MSEERADAILTEFAGDPTAKVADWAARYPTQARDFAYLAAERAFSSPVVDSTRAQSLGLAVLREKRAAYGATLVSLKSAVEAKGYTAESLSTALKLPIGLFWKLHRRLVAFETIPQALVSQLANKLERSADELARYLRQPPQLAAGASYRNDSAPEALQESFSTALSTDPDTTDEMRQSWG